MKALLIGAGGIAYRHADALLELGAEISGVYDTDPVKARALADRYGGKAADCPEEAMKEADLIYLLTPPSKRLQYAGPAMEMGKPLFLEKPAAADVGQAIEMERMSQKYDACVMIGFTQRFREGYRRLGKLIEEDEIGEIIQAFCLRVGPGPGYTGTLADSWRTDPAYVCGMTVESLSHDIDFLRSLAGEITDARGRIKGTVPSLPAFDNNADALLTFAGGAIGTITASWSSSVAYNIKGVIGTKGAAFLQGNDIWDSTRLIYGKQGQKSREEALDDIFSEGKGYLEENRYFLECVEKGRKPCCDLSAGRRVLELSEQILRTAKEAAGNG